MNSQHSNVGTRADNAIEQLGTYEHLGDVGWLPESRRLYRVAKRLFDVVFSLFALLSFAPLFAFIATAIKLTSSGPIFYKQRRVGYHGKVFSLLRFRTMYQDVPAKVREAHLRTVVSNRASENFGFKLKADPRITPLGRWLRRTSLDELPQFWNVLIGDMSVVGPRAALPYEVESYEQWHKLRFSRKPGIAGLWQVDSRRRRTTFDEMVKVDIEYMKDESFLLDAKILLKTPRIVFSKSDE